MDKVFKVLADPCPTRTVFGYLALIRPGGAKTNT